MKCPHCYNPVHAMATRCEHCQGEIDPVANAKSTGIAWMIIFGVIVLLAQCGSK